MLGAGDTVWVADTNAASISRIDVGQNKVVATVTGIGDPHDMTAGPYSLASVDGKIWANVPGQGMLYEIDPATNRATPHRADTLAKSCGVLIPAPHVADRGRLLVFQQLWTL